MKSTIQLYGIEPSEFVHLNYIDALLIKFGAARQMVYDAMELHHTIRGESWMDSYNAVNHNRNLLIEALGSDEANKRIQIVIDNQRNK